MNAQLHSVCNENSSGNSASSSEARTRERPNHDKPLLYCPRPLQTHSECRQCSSGNECVKRRRDLVGKHESDQEREELMKTGMLSFQRDKKTKQKKHKNRAQHNTTVTN